MPPPLALARSAVGDRTSHRKPQLGHAAVRSYEANLMPSLCLRMYVGDLATHRVYTLETHIYMLTNVRAVEKASSQRSIVPHYGPRHLRPGPLFMPSEFPRN